METDRSRNKNTQSPTLMLENIVFFICIIIKRNIYKYIQCSTENELKSYVHRMVNYRKDFFCRWGKRGQDKL
jgi:hypothetical protein